MATAKKIRQLQGFQGYAALYELSEPLATDDGGTRFVIVSASDVMFSGPETYIFPAKDEHSDSVSDWGELTGSYRGGLSHRAALEGAGYEVIE